ncbi:MAG: FtsX-like permease family protein [Bacteroidota bacterium]|nr:FtsX-like permease family protein [Bacteroidota bacterium]
MRVDLFIARRYLISKKKTNVINIISGIAVTGVVIGTTALVIILSVMNGFHEVISSFLSTFDPQLKIELKEGKTFNLKDAPFEKVRKVEGVAHFSQILEDNALASFRGRKCIATIKGVDSEYSNMSGLDTMMSRGYFILKTDNNNFAVVGRGVAVTLGVQVNLSEPLNIYYPKKGRGSTLGIGEDFTSDFIYPIGIFHNDAQIESKYILVPIDFTRKLFDSPDRLTSIEIGLDKKADIDQVKKDIEKIVGDKFVVKDRYQQHDMLYKTIKSEKGFVFLFLAFILAIASLNIIGSLSMIIIDKKEDISILKSMGASSALIRRIFLFEGWLVSVIGAIIGLIIGLIVCWLQIEFGLVPFPEGGFIITSYPVKVDPTDLIFIMLTVLSIGFVTAWYPIRFISGRYLNIEE